MNKMSSAQPVSDECLGRMLAETHVMCKTAGIAEFATKVRGALAPSTKNMVQYFSNMAVPLAIGMGIAGMNALMKQKANKELHEQGERVYGALARHSDVIKSDPAMAREAFDTLRGFAPALAARPMVVKSFVENAVSWDGKITPDMVQQLANTQQAVSKLNESAGGAFIAGLKEPMSVFSFGIGGKDEHKKSEPKRLELDPMTLKAK